MIQLTEKQAYLAMFKFLERLQEQTESEDLAGFLGAMSLLEDGTPADPGIWEDWLDVVGMAERLNDDDIRLHLRKEPAPRK